MRLEVKSFRTRVARRIFVLFVLCAMLPVTTLAVVSYFHVRSQLISQSEDRLREEAKAVSVSVYERLLFLRAEMRTTATLLQASRPQDASGVWPSRESESGTHLRGLVWLRGGHFQPLFGAVAKVPTFSEGQRHHLQKGQVLLVVDAPQRNVERMLLVLEMPDDKEAGQSFLIGEIDPAYLWEAAERRPPGTEIMILGLGGDIFYSSMPKAAVPPQIEGNQLLEKHSGQFRWSDRSQTYLASFTSVFTSTNFYYRKWAILLSEPIEQIFAPMASFKVAFPVLVALTLAMVFILSVNLIHRSLGPIESLQKATAVIAGGDYTQPVEIKSGDEFEALGRSFNEMRRKIEESQNLVVRSAKMATMGQMSGGIIHEIKQPLAAIHGQIQLLQLNPNLNEEEKDRMDAVMEAVERMNTTMGRFTAFSHMGEGKMQAVFLPDVVDRIHKLLDHQLMRKGIAYTENHQPKLPNIQGDLQGMQQVISNVMINAIHAIEEKGGENPMIVVRSRIDNGEVVLEIEDNGCGMPEDVMIHMYDPFFTTKEPGKGTGLGMPIVESILHKHGATIDVKSRVGVGTRFSMRFPVGGR